MEKLIIRDLLIEDYKSIYLLNKDGLGYDFEMNATKQRLEYIVQKTDNKIYIAQIDDRVAGYIHCADYDCTYSESVKNILSLVVSSEYRGFGIGKKLLSRVEQWAKESGSIGVRLVSGFNREDAHKFYISCGYTDRKNQKNFVKIF